MPNSPSLNSLLIPTKSPQYCCRKHTTGRTMTTTFTGLLFSLHVKVPYMLLTWTLYGLTSSGKDICNTYLLKEITHSLDFLYKASNSYDFGIGSSEVFAWKKKWRWYWYKFCTFPINS